MHVFGVCGYVPHFGCGIKYRVASHPTVLGGVEMQIDEWAEPLR
jgi:hypothetical protein